MSNRLRLEQQLHELGLISQHYKLIKDDFSKYECNNKSYIKVGEVPVIVTDGFFRKTAKPSKKVNYINEYGTIIDVLNRYGISYSEHTSNNVYSPNKQHIRFIILEDEREKVDRIVAPLRQEWVKSLFEESRHFYLHVQKRKSLIGSIAHTIEDGQTLKTNRGHRAYEYPYGFSVNFSSVTYRQFNYGPDMYTTIKGGEIPFYNLGLQELKSNEEIWGLGFAILESMVSKKAHNIDELIEQGNVFVAYNGVDKPSYSFYYKIPQKQEVSTSTNKPQKELEEW